MKEGNEQQIYTRSWPLENPRIAIALVHGQGEHIGRYDHLAAWFNAKGVAVYGYDQQGHGKSGGKRGHATDLDSMITDYAAHVQRVRAMHPDIPVFGYAHSMGGQIALNAALKGHLAPYQISGLVATSPWVRLAFEAPAIKIFVGKLLKSILPGFTLPTGLAAGFVSRDPEVVKRYINDPLNHGKVSAAGGMALLEGADYLNTYQGAVPFPILIMHGTADKLTSQKASEELAARLSGDVTYRAWAGFYHELHNEKEQNEVFEVALAWLEEKVVL
jgi:alpha-beta hydrolase superfamily lysophospholipase